ncbi:MAG: condensation domain-containing protein [Vicinamibacterales bacterium]
MQRVLSDVQLAIPVRTVGDADELTELLRQELALPLDTIAGPPIRATLVHAGSAGTYLLIVLTHHTMDGWSLGVFARECAAIVEAGDDGTQLPPVPMQYHDFAAWQLQQFRDGHFFREERFWHEQWKCSVTHGSPSRTCRSAGDRMYRRRRSALLMSVCFSRGKRARRCADSCRS